MDKDNKAMNILFNGIDDDMFDSFINCPTAKEDGTLFKLYVKALNKSGKTRCSYLFNNMRASTPNLENL